MKAAAGEAPPAWPLGGQRCVASYLAAKAAAGELRPESLLCADRFRDVTRPSYFAANAAAGELRPEVFCDELRPAASMRRSAAELTLTRASSTGMGRWGGDDLARLV